MNWKRIKPDHPKPGDAVLLYNGIRPLVTLDYRPGVTSPLARYPVTHYLPLELPYKPLAEDRTDMDNDRRKPRCGR